MAGLAGKDATEDFEEIGHSNSAKEMLTKYVIGSYEVRAGFGGRCGMGHGDIWHLAHNQFMRLFEQAAQSCSSVLGCAVEFCAFRAAWADDASSILLRRTDIIATSTWCCCMVHCVVVRAHMIFGKKRKKLIVTLPCIWLGRRQGGEQGAYERRAGAPILVSQHQRRAAENSTGAAHEPRPVHALC